MARWREIAGQDGGERFTLPASIEDGRIPGFARALLYWLSGITFLTIVWLSFAQVRERVVADGAILPSGSMRVIEHLEGGIVEEINVKEGESVRAGTVLMSLRPEAAASELGQLRIREAVLALEVERLDATVARREPDLPATGAFADFATDQMTLYRADRTEIDEKQITFTARLSRARGEVASLEAQMEVLKSQIAIQEEQVAMREKLLKDGFSSRKDYLEARYRLEQVRQEEIAAKGNLDAARDALKEAGSELARDAAETGRRLSEERKERARELAEIRQQIATQADRNARLEIRTSEDSIVLELAVKGVGEVVNPGDVVAKLVPVGSKLVADVKLRPQDVDDVRSGQDAEVTVTALDPNVYGTIKGTVDLVSASTFKEDDGTPYYRAEISIASTDAGYSAIARLRPGMVVEASIVTGAKSILRYLLKPVDRSLHRAFSEK